MSPAVAAKVVGIAARDDQIGAETGKCECDLAADALPPPVISAVRPANRFGAKGRQRCDFHGYSSPQRMNDGTAMIKSTQALLLLIAIVTSTMARGDDAANAAARGVMDAFMTAFNAKTVARGRYSSVPHVRFAGVRSPRFRPRGVHRGKSHRMR